MDIHLKSGNCMFQHKPKMVRALLSSSLASSCLLLAGISYADDYINSAQVYLSKNDFNSATIELKNAIQSSPKDATPRLMLGKLYLQHGNFPAAEQELSRALQLGAEKAQVLPLLARTLVAMGRNDDAAELINESTVSEPSAKADLIGLQAIAEFNLRREENANKLIADASKTVDSKVLSQSVYFNLAQVRQLNTQNKTTEAQALLDHALKIDENNSDIWLLKGHMDLAQKQFEQATQDYKKAYSISPSANLYSIFVANALVLSKQFKEATPYVDRILKAIPDYPVANELKATILYSEKNYEGAKDAAEKAINNGSQNTATMLISAVSAYQLKLYEQANRRLKQVLPRLPANHFANRLYIVTLMKLGYINQAVEKMESMDTASEENSNFLSQMGLALSKLGRNDEALSLATKAYDSNKNASSELMLGMVKLADNDESGLKELQSAIAEQPDQRKAAIGAAYYYLQLGKLDDAQAVADKWLAKDAKDIDALGLQGQISLVKKEYPEAEKTFRTILSISPDLPKVQELLARTLFLQEKYQGAYDLAYKVKQKIPNSIPAIQILFASAQKLKKMDDVLALIEKQISANPTDITLLHQKAFALITEGKNEAALALLENIPNESKTGETWSLIGNLYALKRSWIDADRAYQNWVKLSPNNVNAYLRSLQIYEEWKKYPSGVALAEKAHSQFPEDTRFVIIKGNMQLRSGDPKAAQQTLDTLPDAVKNSVYALTLQESIYVANRDLKRALPLQEKIHQMAPGLTTARELASLYEASGQRDKAIKFLEKEIATHAQKARPLQILLADIQSRANPDAAIDEYLQIIKREPSNVIALNNIAWLYIDKGDFGEACKYSGQAYKIAQQEPVIADTHGYCLLKSGDVTNALPILSQAYEATKTRNNAEIALHYAEGLIQSKQKSQAQTLLNTIQIPANSKLAADKSNLVQLVKSI